MSIKLCLCTPMYGGMCNAAFMSSCLQLQNACRDLQIEFTYLFIVSESLISRARNKLCKYFLDTNYTHLLFIDADIEFRVEDIINMIKSNKDIIGGAYSIKSIDWNKIADCAKNGICNPDTLKQAGLTKVSNNIISMDIDSRITNVEEVLEIGTGLMLIKREVLLRMIKKYPSDIILLDSPEDMNKSIEERKYFIFFDTMREGTRYLSEDYMFCKRWKDMGGKIYLYKNTKTKHWGSYAYEYNNS